MAEDNKLQATTYDLSAMTAIGAVYQKKIL